MASRDDWVTSFVSRESRRDFAYCNDCCQRRHCWIIERANKVTKSRKKMQIAPTENKCESCDLAALQQSVQSWTNDDESDTELMSLRQRRW